MQFPVWDVFIDIECTSTQDTPSVRTTHMVTVRCITGLMSFIAGRKRGLYTSRSKYGPEGKVYIGKDAIRFPESWKETPEG